MDAIDTKALAGQSAPAPTFMDRIKPVLRSNEFVMLLVLIALLTVSSLIKASMIDVRNLNLMTREIAILGIAAVGVGFPIITAGIDLSIGSMIGLGGVMVAMMIMNWQLPIVVSIILTLALGVVIGAIHGLFVTKLKMHGFLITLVTLGLARGAITVITNAFPITGLPDEFTVLGQGDLFGAVPVPVIIFLIYAGLGFYLLRYTYIGRQIYAVGGNIEAARYSGVNVDARIILAYIISVVCSMTVGMIQAGRLTMGHPGTGEGYELLAIAACILGGYSLMGGEGNIIGIVIGAALIGVLQNAMVILQISPYWHKIVISAALGIAITIDYLRRRRR